MSQALSKKIDQIIIDYEMPLLNYVTGIIKDPSQAKDVVQDALIRYLKAQEKEMVIKNDRAWLYRVCHNLSLDYLRKIKRKSRLEEHLPIFQDESSKSPDAELSLKEQTNMVLASLKELNEREQTIINMKVREHKSYKDIAEAMGLTVNNVGFILHRSMKKLALIFKEKAENEVAP